jgi:hypothetical protein
MACITGLCAKYCALWSLPPLNAAAVADQKTTPPVTIGRRAAAAAAYSVGADVYTNVG